jgi:hypothetical protein
MRIFSALLSALVLSVALPAQSDGAKYPPLVADPAARPDDHFTRALRAGLDRLAGDRQAGNPGIQHATAHWSEAARTAAQQMFDKYGSPQETTPNRLVWHDNRPWKSTAVVNEEVTHNFPTPHLDVLEQTVAIDVPPDKFGVLAQFDGSITANRTGGELTVRCDREEINFIALNLASDLIAGKLSVDQARRSMTELAQAVKSGQQPAYATDIQFSLPVSTRTGDADHSTDGQNRPRAGW